MHMTPVLNRLVRYGLVGGTAASVHIVVLLLLGQWMGLSLANPIASVASINEHQMVHLRQGHDPLHEGADQLGFVEAGRHHTHLLAGHQCAVCTV